MLLLVATQAVAGDGPRPYRGSRLGIEFLVPRTMKIRSCSNDLPCIRLESAVSKQEILVEIIEAPVEVAVEKVAVGFERIGGQWTKYGRSTAEPATISVSRNLTIISGDGDCLFDDQQGSHLTTCTEVLITNGKRTVHIEGNVLVAKELSVVIGSLRF